MPNGSVVQEQIYVHGKLMIVDDRSILMGSANINDRSLLGKHDSEVSVLVEGGSPVYISRMNGGPWPAGSHAHSLRALLYLKHLGLRMDQVQLVVDPLGRGMREFMDRIAESNTLVYRQMFRAVPDDLVASFDRLKTWEPEAEVHSLGKEEAMARLKSSLQGNLVQWPLQFLKDATLTFGWSEKEGLLNPALFR